MKRWKRALGSLLPLVVLLLLLSSTGVSANSAQPPNLTVIVTFPPKQLALSLRYASGETSQANQMHLDQRGWESTYRLFNSKSMVGAVLIVNSNEKSFECPLPADVKPEHTALVTLDFQKETLQMGKNPLRNVVMVALRVLLTLLIEGAIFFGFGYRQRRSWIAFFVVNLLTQGALNWILCSLNGGYLMIIELLFLECIILVVEMIALALAIKEHRERRAVGFAFVANTASFLLGCILLSILPI